MPVVSIETRKKYIPEQELALMKLVQRALSDAFKILNDDVYVRLFVHEAHRSLIPEMIDNPELYTFITIDCYPGRSLAVKRELYANLANQLSNFGIPKDHIKILIRESVKDNWGIRGGRAGCDIDNLELGYSVEI